MFEADTDTTAGLNPSARMVKVDVAAFVALGRAQRWWGSASIGRRTRQSQGWWGKGLYGKICRVPNAFQRPRPFETRHLSDEPNKKMIISASCLLHLELSVRPSAQSGPDRTGPASCLFCMPLQWSLHLCFVWLLFVLFRTTIFATQHHGCLSPTPV